jgi:RNA recognition motif-containing protein
LINSNLWINKTINSSFNRIESKKIFVAGFHQNESEDELRKIFSQFRKVESLCIKTPPLKHLYAFVEFSQEEAASNAIKQSNVLQIGGRYVQIEKPKQERNPQSSFRVNSLILNFMILP